MPDIVRLLPQGGFKTFWEPFVGGGALFFALGRRITTAQLSDHNLDLVLAYQVLRKRPDELVAALKDHASRHGKEHYLAVRASHDMDDPVAVAARFIYLNKTCYNGLWRVNRRGRFNVPMGSYKNPTICDEDNLRAASRALATAVIRYQSFERIQPARGDLVYCDPPYDDTFTGYTPNGFGPTDQERLRDCCRAWAGAGAHVIISNSNTPRIRKLYAGAFTVHEVTARRHLNCRADGRGATRELLIVT